MNEEKAHAATGMVARHLPGGAGHEGLAAVGVLAAHGLLYMPHNNLCMDYEGIEANYIAGTPYVGANVSMYAGPGRPPRRVHGVGPGRAAHGVEDQGALPGLERRAW